MVTARSVVVVGGGLAGLTSAIVAARAGAAVTVLERADAAGGMARSTPVTGFRLNFGPRALYPPAASILDDLGIPYSFGKPALTGLALRDGVFHPMPDGVGALLRSPLFTEAAGRTANAALGALVQGDRAEQAGISLDAWLDARGIEAIARQFVTMIVRLASYIDAPDLISAAAAAEQLIDSAEGVRYVDGGWQTIADGMVQAAERAGVRIRYGARAASILAAGGTVRGVALTDGEEVPTAAVVLAVAPDVARSLLAAADVTVPPTTPVRAAALDVALRSLPNPDAGYLAALDQPLYLSVHSLAARFSDEGGEVIHVARYLHPRERPRPADVRAELEWLLDHTHPGWRDVLVHQRLLPDITVTHALPEAASGGMPGRPSVRVDGLAGAFLAGDWVGDEHQLAAAALASGRRAGVLAAAHGSGDGAPA